MRSARTACLVLLLAAAVLPAVAQGLDDEGPIIAEIVVEGGVTITEDTVEYYLGLLPGDPLDPAMVSEGFQRLWDSGLVEDLRIDVEQLDSGEVKLYVVVKERPFVTSVVFEGNKKVSTSTIKDRLDERGIEVPRNVPLKLPQLQRIQKALKEVYDVEGYRSAQISFNVEELAANKRRVVYTIEEGGKVKIDDIEFVGNDVFSDSRLKRALKKTKEVRFYRPWGKKIIFSSESWEEDRDNLRNFYMNHGFKDVKVGQPETELVAKHPKAETLKKKKFRLKVVVPVEEGEPYDLGTLQVSGTEVYKGEDLQRLFEIEPGKRYSYKVIEDGMEKVRDIYHNTGYIYAYTNQVLENREGADHVVDVTVDVFEGDRFRLGRLEFKGNTTTRDKVLRREFRIAESNYMSMGVFKSSVFKVNALGYWKLEEEPLDFDFDDENKKVNVDVKGHEVGRNDIQFGAGYSELDGFFGQAQFNTRNFLGRGNTLGVSVQIGGRADYYTLSFTEPYFLDRRIILGGSVFKTNLDITDFVRETTGVSLTTGLGVGTFSSVSALISWEDVHSEYAVSLFRLAGDDDGGHVRPIDPPPVVPVERNRTFEVFDGSTASITPSYGFDSRDDPFDPNRGFRFNLRSRFAGGPLGGDYDYVRPELTMTKFVSLGKKFVLGLNFEAGQFFSYGDSEIPFYERYRIGGDRSLRGIPYYTVVPRNADGSYYRTTNGSTYGGDRYWVANFEYQIRVGGPVKLVFFLDAGNTYFDTQGWDLGLFRRTTGAELRIFLPIFQAPIRFIYGYNLDPFPDEDSSDFQFSIGTTF